MPDMVEPTAPMDAHATATAPAMQETSALAVSLESTVEPAVEAENARLCREHEADLMQTNGERRWSDGPMEEGDEEPDGTEERFSAELIQMRDGFGALLYAESSSGSPTPTEARLSEGRHEHDVTGHGAAYRAALVADMHRREEAARSAGAAPPASPTTSPPSSPIRTDANPLHAELRKAGGGCAERVTALLNEGGIMPHVGARDGRGRLPVHIAAIAGARAEILALLVKHGGAAQVLEQDAEGRVALHFAAQHDSGLDGLLYLLSVGGQRQLRIQDAGGRLPIHLAAASNAGDSILVHLFAVGGACQLSACDHAGRRPLHFAAMLNPNVAALRYLMGVGGGTAQLFGKR
jgi:hypothetical protein